MTGESEVKAEFIMPVAELAKGAELNFSLADAPRKQLRYLRPEVEDKNPVMHDYSAW